MQKKEWTEMLQALVIGASTMGRTHGHGTAYASMPGVKLAGIAVRMEEAQQS